MADTEVNSNYNTHNYFAHGGSELVIGGKLTFLPGAVVDGGGSLFGTAEIVPAANVPESTATTVAALKDNFNALLAALKDAGLMIPDDRK